MMRPVLLGGCFVAGRAVGSLRRVLLAGCLVALAAAQDQRTCTPGCFGNGGDVCSGDSCFFSDCTCEFHGTVSGCVPTSGCLGWRQTGGCSASGARESSNDKGCCDYVQMGNSGYCECAGGAQVRAVGCGHDNFHCQSECELAGYVDCVGGWSAWTACSSTCVGGVRTRTYTVTTPAGTEGTACPTADGEVETETCNDDVPCPIDCEGSWSACDEMCTNSFTQTVAAEHGGAECEADPGCESGDGSCIKGEVVSAVMVLDGNITTILPETSRACECSNGRLGLAVARL